jgi:spore coat polysaccharide biosynthesis protein SpsF
MNVVAVVQARLGSTRLPGKVMYPLDGSSTIRHIINRTGCICTLSETIVAIPVNKSDSVISNEVGDLDATIFQGSESDVLQRIYNAAKAADADVIVRICADNPLFSPEYVDCLVKNVVKGDIDYATNNNPRTIPVGLDAEAFTMKSFSRVANEAQTQSEREHVTPYYKNRPEEFKIANITSDQIFSEEHLLERDDLRLTLDTPADYELLKQVYLEVEKNEHNIIPVSDAIKYIDRNNLSEKNNHINQNRLKSTNIKNNDVQS